VGAVLVPTDLPRLEGMDDSKQVAPRARERAVGRLQATAAVLATISLVEAAGIDQDGMSACLHQAFRAAIQALIDLGVTADISRSEG
jgi:ribonuclease HII